MFVGKAVFKSPAGPNIYNILWWPNTHKQSVTWQIADSVSFLSFTTNFLSICIEGGCFFFFCEKVMVLFLDDDKKCQLCKKYRAWHHLFISGRASEWVSGDGHAKTTKVRYVSRHRCLYKSTFLGWVKLVHYSGVAHAPGGFGHHSYISSSCLDWRGTLEASS